MNKGKKKIMVVNGWERNSINIKVGGGKIMEVKEFRYWGSNNTRWKKQEINKK